MKLFTNPIRAGYFLKLQGLGLHEKHNGQGAGIRSSRDDVIIVNILLTFLLQTLKVENRPNYLQNLKQFRPTTKL